MALAGVKLDSDSGGFVSNCFPVRGLLKRDLNEGKLFAAFGCVFTCNTADRLVIHSSMFLFTVFIDLFTKPNLEPEATGKGYYPESQGYESVRI